MTDFRTGDILRYDPTDRHCREGYAVVTEHGIFDTYWRGVDATRDGASYLIADEEIETARLVVNVDEVREFGRHEYPSFEHYDADDRFVVTSQHGHRVHRLLRKDAEPSQTYETVLHLSQAVEAVYAVNSALTSLERKAQTLAESVDKSESPTVVLDYFPSPEFDQYAELRVVPAGEDWRDVAGVVANYFSGPWERIQKNISMLGLTLSDDSVSWTTVYDVDTDSSPVVDDSETADSHVWIARIRLDRASTTAQENS